VKPRRNNCSPKWGRVNTVFSKHKNKIVLLCIVTAIGVIAAVCFLPPKYTRVAWPDGKDFAFTIVDDTDVSSIANVKPVYDYLYDLGLITTKTVWVSPTNDPNIPENAGQTLSDPDYLSFILELQNRGFEIASHGPRGGHTKRAEIIDATERFRELIGHYPYTHINHSDNKENLYWGENRLDFLPLKILFRILKDEEKDRFLGHMPDSEYFWGDIAQRNTTYVRNLTFQGINTLKVNPSMPYHDPTKPYVNNWFSSSNGTNVDAFNRLLMKKNIDRLEKEGGLCMIYTHFAYGFVSEGDLNATTRERLQDLASRNGWFAPANEILAYLKQHNKANKNLGWREKLTMEIRWAWEKFISDSR